MAIKSKKTKKGKSGTGRTGYQNATSANRTAAGGETELLNSGNPDSDDLEFLDFEDAEDMPTEELESSAQKRAKGSGESDILDDLEFISHETARDRSKMASGDKIEGTHVSKKKTTRRAVDSAEAKREKSVKFAKKNIHWIIIAVIAIIVLLVLARYAIRTNRANRAAENQELPVSTQEYETDAYEEINELLENYYDCYAQGDTETILQYAYPMSDSEKSYIQMYSAYVDSYENVTCYTKTTDEEGVYIVSASFYVEYTGIDTAAAGMDFFLIRTDSSGNYYIDNIYSPFNLVYQEYSLDQTVVTLIQDYESGDDIISLQASVQTRYEQALESDKELSALVEGTLADAISVWITEHEAEIAEKAAAAAAAVESEDSSDSSDSTDTAETSDTSDTGESPVTSDGTSYTETESRAWVTVTDTVNIRSEPSENGEILASALSGSEVRQIAVTSNGWVKIYTGDITGYIKQDYISE